MRRLLSLSVSAVLGLGSLQGLVTGFGELRENQRKDEIILTLTKANQHKDELIEKLGNRSDVLSMELDSSQNTAFYLRRKWQLDEEEIKNLKHIVATFENGNTDTVYREKLVIDTAQLNKVKIENKRQIDSLKRKLRDDSVLLSRKGEIGVRPKNK